MAAIAAGCPSGSGSSRWSTNIHFRNERQTVQQVPTDEIMLKISSWKCSVRTLSPSGPIYHEYVVVKTNRAWWSIEKECQGLIVARSVQWAEIVHRCMYRKDRRKGKVSVQKSWRTVKPGSTTGTMINWLKAEEIPRGYGMLTNNCLDFVQRMYRRFAM